MLEPCPKLGLAVPPNPWEVGWIFWHAVGNGTDPIDRTHFYYFLVRTNGVEVGKYDGGTNPKSQKNHRKQELSK